MIKSFSGKALLGVSIRYGVIGGLVSVALLLVFYFLGRNPLVDIRIVDIVVLAIFVFFALKELRDRYMEGKLHYWQGLTAGIATYLVIALISAISILILTGLIDTEMTQRYIDSRIELLETNRQTLVETIDEEAYREALSGVKKTTPLYLALDDFLKKSIMGLFVTIIIAVILRR